MSLIDKAKKLKLVEQEVDPAQEQRELQGYAENMWHWLRTTLDQACDIYQHEGKEELLHECLSGEAFDQVKTLLDSYRAQNMVWAYPKEKRNDFTLKLESIINETWVVTEYFRDFSYLQRYQNNQLVETIQGDGADKVLRATIVTDGEVYRIAQLALISDPTRP